VSIQGIEDLDFSAVVAAAGARALTVTLTGNADLNVKFDLERFMIAVHEEARRIGAAEVVVDVRGLEFMNSSCFKSLVRWISSVQALAARHQYRITFVASPEMYWQRRSLGALAGLATEIVSVSV
jgi:hypothetical protein